MEVDIEMKETGGVPKQKEGKNANQQRGKKKKYTAKKANQKKEAEMKETQATEEKKIETQEETPKSDEGKKKGDRKRKAETSDPNEGMEVEGGGDGVKEGGDWTFVSNEKKKKMKEKKKQQQKKAAERSANRKLSNSGKSKKPKEELTEEEKKQKWIQKHTTFLEGLKPLLTNYHEIRSQIEQQNSNTTQKAELLTQKSQLESKLCEAIQAHFKEKNGEILEQVISVLSPEVLFQTLQKTLEIEVNGGMEITDPSRAPRRRTTGGVFFYLVKQALPLDDQKRIFASQKKSAKRQKTQMEE